LLAYIYNLIVAHVYSEIEKPVYQQPPPPPPPQPEPPKRSLVFPVYYGKSLVAEIRYKPFQDLILTENEC
jgi:hypothetical protein